MHASVPAGSRWIVLDIPVLGGGAPPSDRGGHAIARAGDGSLIVHGGYSMGGGCNLDDLWWLRADGAWARGCPSGVAPSAPELKGSIGEGPNHSNHSNHSNSFKIEIFRNFSLENSKISENFNIKFF